MKNKTLNLIFKILKRLDRWLYRNDIKKKQQKYQKIYREIAKKKELEQLKMEI